MCRLLCNINRSDFLHRAQILIEMRFVGKGVKKTFRLVIQTVDPSAVFLQNSSLKQVLGI